MIQPSDIEVLDDKKVILRDIVDYDNNIANNNMSEEKQREIEKLNEEFKDIVRKNKLTTSTDIGRINNNLKTKHNGNSSQTQKLRYGVPFD